jgi:hypothetical protein
MSVRSDVRRISERLLPPNGDCPGVPMLMKIIQEGAEEPSVPLCPLCHRAHWPHESVQKIAYVVVGHARPREDGAEPA